MEDSDYLYYSNFNHNSQSSFDVNYDSDKIDSDIEDILYASVHHQTIDSNELSTNRQFEENGKQYEAIQSSIIDTPKIINQKKVLKKKKKKLKCKNGFNNGKADNQEIENNNNDEKQVNGKALKCKMLKANEFDITYGNNIVLSNDLKMSNQFYSEDSYNSDDEIEDVIRKMPSDKRYWKVFNKDRLNRTSKFKQKIQNYCQYCFSADHFIRNCPNVFIFNLSI